MIDKYGCSRTALWCGEGAIAQRELIESALPVKNGVSPRRRKSGAYVAALALAKFPATISWSRPTRCRRSTSGLRCGIESLMSTLKHEVLSRNAVATPDRAHVRSTICSKSSRSRKQSGLSRWGWAAYYAELQGGNRDLLLVASRWMPCIDHSTSPAISSPVKQPANCTSITSPSETGIAAVVTARCCSAACWKKRAEEGQCGLS